MLVQPPLELHGPRDVQPGQELTSIQFESLLPVGSRDRAAEIDRVTSNSTCLHTYGFSAAGDDFFAEARSQYVECLIQGVAGAGRVRLGPEEGADIFTTPGPVSLGENEIGQQSQSFAARCDGTHKRSVGPEQLDGAQRPKLDHVIPTAPPRDEPPGATAAAIIQRCVSNIC